MFKEVTYDTFHLKLLAFPTVELQHFQLLSFSAKNIQPRLLIPQVWMVLSQEHEYRAYKMTSGPSE